MLDGRTSNHLHFHTGFGSGANWTGWSRSGSTTDRRVSLAVEESCNELISVSWDAKSKHRLVSRCRYSQLFPPDSFSLGRPRTRRLSEQHLSARPALAANQLLLTRILGVERRPGRSDRHVCRIHFVETARSRRKLHAVDCGLWFSLTTDA